MLLAVSSSKQLILFNPTGGNINFASLFLEICKSFDGKDINGFILHTIRELKKIREFLKGGKESKRSEVLGLYAEMLVFKLLLSKLKDEKKLLSSWSSTSLVLSSYAFSKADVPFLSFSGIKEETL